MVRCPTCKGQRIVEEAGWPLRICPTCRGVGQLPAPVSQPRHWWRR
jgi:hypothetical protein